VESVTPTYSWRLLQNFGAHNDYLTDIRRATRPMHVFVGEADQLLDAQKLKAAFYSQRTDTAVVLLPGLCHSDMVTSPDAIRVLAAAF
jgi:pimeloyl-ACP methyl ester carboxylesterase